MKGTLRCPLGSEAQHAHYLEDHTWSIQQSTSTHTNHFHNIQQQNNNHTQTSDNTVANGFNQMAPPVQTITVALYMSKVFDTINIHTLIRKLLQTKIPGTIINFIANYIKGRKAYTTYRNHKSSQRQFNNGVPQGGILSPTLFNIYTAHIRNM